MNIVKENFKLALDQLSADISGNKSARLLKKLENYVLKDLYIEGAMDLAEIYSLQRIFVNNKKAYLFFNIYYYDKVYSVKFFNESPDNSTYLGVISDFRNEPIVSEVVDYLNFQEIIDIDSQAQYWRRENSLLRIIEE